MSGETLSEWKSLLTKTFCPALFLELLIIVELEAKKRKGHTTASDLSLRIESNGKGIDAAQYPWSVAQNTFVSHRDKRNS